MEIHLSKETLLDGIQLVQNAVSPKSSLPILSNVLLEAGKDQLTMTTTDLDIGISSTIPASVTIAGAITVPAKKFFDIIRTLPDGSDIDLSMKKNNFVTVKSGKVQFKIIGLPKEEFPQLPIFENKDAISMEQKTLKEMFTMTDFAISKDDTRFVLNGVFFTVKGDKLNMVATDGRRLAAIKKKLDKTTLIDREVIIPTKTVQEVKRMLGEEGEINIQFSDNQVMFVFPTCVILSRLIEGEYPNYKNVIPEKSKQEIKIQRDDFLSAAKRASIFTDQDSMAIKLKIKKKKMTISKNTPYLGEAREEIDVDYNGGEELEIGFNPRYLIDVLKNLNEEEVLFEVNNPNKPGVIRRGEEYSYVILPMQIVA